MKILLVDDHADTLRVMHRLLSRHGHEVRTADTVRQAVEVAGGGGSFDLLLSDVGLPDGTGIDLLGALRSRQPRLAAIAITGYGAEEDVRQCRSAGFDGHLLKPVTLEVLLGAIEQVAPQPVEAD